MMYRRGNSFGDWFFLIIMIAAVVLLLVNISKDSGRKKPINFQSWSLSLIDTYILKPLKEL